ncbi:glycosyltransferase family 1 protein [Tannerella sp. AM09-19]|nr:glycosyltransferase family 1 protein [Tannerella sp. AM09-19]
MNILVDLTYILPGKVSGVMNYSFRLLLGLKKCNYQNSIILLVTSKNYQLISNNFPEFKILVFNSIEIKKIPHIRGILNRNRINFLIKKNNIDLFFSPYIVYYGLYSTIVPFVGVLHDAQGFVLMSNWVKQIAYNIFTRHILKKLIHLVTISKFAKTDILKRVHNLSVPISVIYNSIYYEDDTVNIKMENTNKYILNVNTLEPYKNLITLVKAFNMLKEEIPHFLYIKATRLPYWDNVILPYIKKYGIENRVKLIEKEFSEKEMANLYRNADLFVSPSLMEGFGFTPIEAALYGVPVVCSMTPALFETTRGLLNYYEPATDPYVLKETILEVLRLPRKNLGIIAQEYISIYSIECQAKNFISLFEKIQNRISV